MFILIFSLLWLALVGLSAIAIVLEYLEDGPADGLSAPTLSLDEPEPNGFSTIFLF